MKAKCGDKQAKVRVFSTSESQCIWMKAGVVNYKLCGSAYDCLNCPFDKAMSRNVEGKREEFVSWREVQRLKSYDGKECRHMLTGRVQYRLCSNAFRCNVCEFDQALDERDISMPEAGVNLRKVAGFSMADDYYYHRGHCWARIENGGFVRIGMDDFALKLLGRTNELILPKLGSILDQTDTGWRVRREDKEAGVLSPMSGVVIATNHKVLENPELTRKDPYGQGWLLVIEPRNLKRNLGNLLFDRESAAWLGAEANRLDAVMTRIYGMPLAASGGEIVDDIYGSLAHAVDWADLVHEFLLT